MRILGYFLPISGLQFPTGVSQHAVNMFREIGRRLERDFRLVLYKDSGSEEQRTLRERCGDLDVEFVRWRQETAYRLGTFFQWPILDYIQTDCDWIYVPKELPICSRKMKVAITVHDLLPFEPEHRWYAGGGSIMYRMRWRWLMRGVLRNANLILTVSEFSKRRLLHFFPTIAPERVIAVGNGVADMFFDSSLQNQERILEIYGLEPRQYVLFSGGLQMRKGGDIIVQLSRRLYEEKVKLTIAVTGRRHDATFQSLAQSTPVDPSLKRLKFLGYVPDQHLVALLHHAFALIFPSRYEGFGLPAIEAMAAGCPVLFHPAGALPEVVGEAGVPVVQNEANAFLDNILALLRDSHRREDLAAIGKARADMFRWSRCVDKLLAAMSTF